MFTKSISSMWLLVLSMFVIAATTYSCSTVPVTGRKQLSLIPESQLLPMSLAQYNEVLNTSTVENNSSDAKMVKRVGRDIANAVETYLRRNKMADRASKFAWEFNLIEEDVANAWAMPGGKTAVYTGILPYTQNEDGLAVVMGHEVAHAVARHGGERMSQGLLQQLGGVGLAIAMRDKPAQTQGIFMQAYGLGTQVGALLPFSRQQETEADQLGMVFMAMAGYNPQEADDFWQRMNSAGGPRPPEFLSTHPAPATRVRNINKWMPTAMKYYQGSGVQNTNMSKSKANTSGNYTVKPRTGTVKPTNSRGTSNTKTNTNTNNRGVVKPRATVKPR